MALANASKAVATQPAEAFVAAAAVSATSDKNPYEENAEHLRQLFVQNNLVSFKIKRIECTAGSSSGDNYMSVVKRVSIYEQDLDGDDADEVDAMAGKGSHTDNSNSNSNMGKYNRTTKSAFSFSNLAYTVIVKRQIASPSRRTLYRCEEAFTNEIHAYNHIVPLLRRFSTQQLFPDCYIAEKHDQSAAGEPIIVLEDLRAAGFRLQNRIAGLELQHCKLVMKKLAELHSASLAAKHLNREEYLSQCQNIHEIVYCEEAAEFYSNILDASIQQAIDSLRATNMLAADEQLTEPIRLIERLQPKLFGQIQSSIVRGAQSELSVMCHGDLWVNNIMFNQQRQSQQHDDAAAEATKEVIFFDLQAMRVTSPIFDILHFLYTSTRRRLREAHTGTLLTTYCDALAANLQRQFANTPAARLLDALRCTFSVQRLSEEYERNIYYGLAICMWIMPAVTFDPDNIPNLDVISELNTNAKEIKCTQKLTPEYHERIKELALEFFEKGYLQSSCFDPDHGSEYLC